MSESGGGTDNIFLNWNPRHLEIKTRTVEKTLEPLVMQVTTLVSSKSPQKKKGKSKRAIVLVAAVEKATANFVEKGELIALENPEIKAEMLATVDEVKATGELMSSTAREFAHDPCSSLKRGNMVRASRNLLSAVTRLLILADMIDVHLLLKKLHRVEDDLEFLKAVSSQAELMDGMDRFGRSTTELLAQAAKRQAELKDPMLRDDLAAARAVLKKHSMMLLTASKAYVRHPELSAAKANRDYVLRQVCEAVNTISEVAQGKAGPGSQSSGPGELAAAMDDFDNFVTMIQPNRFSDARQRAALEEQLESIISGAALMADSSCTRDERRERIVSECNAVRQALQELLHEFSGGGRGGEGARTTMEDKSGDLRRQLRKAVVDHVSDTFLGAGSPLAALVAAAREGREAEVEQLGGIFREHSGKLVEVAGLACSMSSSQEGVKMVRYASNTINQLCPQVINAAVILASRPKSKVAQENMEVFRQTWETQVQILTDAVDDIVTVDDFLAVSENHILEDVNRCCLALQEHDSLTLGRVAGVIRGRSERLGDVVTSEMDNYEPGLYTERVLEAVRLLRSEVMPNFCSHVNGAVAAIDSPEQNKGVDENEFIDASRLVYDGVREVRRAVLLNRGEEDMDSDTEWETEDTLADVSEVGSVRPSVESRTESLIDEYPDISGITNAREAMKKLPEEERVKIQQQVEVFKVEKRAFDREVSKWDSEGNEVIVLAKHMCCIMMEMTDFTRGRGQLKTTMDVINAAKKISEAGTKLDKLARAIADQCPESTTKKDLLAYLQRIALYCHQLNITSKVKADVQNVSGELIVSGLDSATSLIQAAKNLMNAVVLTVKASYVASTKYRKQDTGQDRSKHPLVVWRVKAPEKKPLVRREVPEEVKAKVRKGAEKVADNPFKTLGEFTRSDSEEE